MTEQKVNTWEQERFINSLDACRRQIVSILKEASSNIDCLESTARRYDGLETKTLFKVLQETDVVRNNLSNLIFKFENNIREEEESKKRKPL